MVQGETLLVTRRKVHVDGLTTQPTHSEGGVLGQSGALPLDPLTPTPRLDTLGPAGGRPSISGPPFISCTGHDYFEGEVSFSTARARRLSALKPVQLSRRLPAGSHTSMTGSPR